MRIETDVKLDFKDVLIRPKRSTLSSRNEVDINRSFRFYHTGSEWNGFPLIAANMDVTGTMAMSRSLARHQAMTALHKHYPEAALAEFFAGDQGAHAFYSLGTTAADLDNAKLSQQALLATAYFNLRAADALHDGTPVDDADLRDIGETLRTLLLPHQRDEEEKTFPELARRLGGRDPLGPMARMHAEIAELIARFSGLVAGLNGAAISSAELHEARRLLYVMEAVIALHLATEEELLAQVEDVSAPNG